MRTLLAVLVSSLLCACATPPLPRSEALLKDHLFAAPSQPIDPKAVFAVTPAMQDFLKQNTAAHIRTKDPQLGLYNLVHQSGRLMLDYDSAVTRNASQAFDSRAGNCLSLVIMTAAFARELRIPIQFQSVQVDEAWSRAGNMHFLNGHVNLTLGDDSGMSRFGGDYNADRAITIDFLPPAADQRQRVRAIREHTVLAMYMNNRAAESLLARKVDDAYWWIREAIRQDPSFLTAYNTLGVVYQMHGDLPEAEAVLRQALERQPESAQLLTNLVRVLNLRGNGLEAAGMAQRLAQIQPFAPFHFFDQGQAAMQRGDYGHAKAMFARELQRAGDYHEVHFGLALANLHLGETATAQKHLRLAQENSATRSDRDLYGAKLDRLKATRLN